MSRKKDPEKQLQARSPWIRMAVYTHRGRRIQCQQSGGHQWWTVMLQHPRMVRSAEEAMDVAEGKCPVEETARREEQRAVDRANRQAARQALAGA